MCMDFYLFELLEISPMKNNIIRDDKYIAMKTETISDGTTNTDQSAIALGEMNGDSSIATPTMAHEVTVDAAAPSEHHESITESAEMNIEIPTETPPEIPPEVPPQTPPQTPPPIIPSATAPTIDDDTSVTEPADTWQSTQIDINTFLDNAIASTTEFFKTNQQVLTTLGWIVLALFGIKLMFAGLNIIDDLPLVTPIIKLVGLVTIVRFTWRYLIREHDRQELVESLNRTKIEVLGDRS
jgi:CAAD domains of cyanobacterial aminoacyl-tRNA synthetase